jgi:hypothetical protein
MAPNGKTAAKAESGANLGFEAKLWQMADDEPFEQKMKRLTTTLRQQQTEAAKLDTTIAANQKELGYGG